ncbi:cell division protein FtsH [Candidatus Gottesmanbacteria bacterium RIFCSPHIGHO2_01_FULL_42_12]|uniref:ATP-dependent zinc metalloprotease FtsH n=1 Tax=Candidatus Gottesmanbacteria bacterium RIFCSPHIGHO2_01_FULL_42_12 TaxID=1798377 RepID=A0A1F5Z4B2_9BACT|nr:MAG: cell division protein FtsH [Candidatus Gottesmanbacteria bacterium RIFCSPHIGHO2_01_FULL_42_12]
MEMRFKFGTKDIILWIVVAFFGLTILASFVKVPSNSKTLDISAVFADIKAGKVSRIEVEENDLTVKYKDESVVLSKKEGTESLLRQMESAKIPTDTIEIAIKDTVARDSFISLVSNFLPIILMGVLFFWIFRKAQGAQDSMMSFGSSKAKLYTKDLPKVTFKDVAGVDEAKKELEEIVDFLKNPKKYAAVGARTPKGVLLVGPSGTGKTLLAKAIAGEAGVPFFAMAGSEFMEMLVGVGASRARDLFATAKKNKPAIIFIDEIDAIGRARSMGAVGGHDEREQTLNQILVEMDGFEPNEQVVVVAATNRGDLLDPALMRPGRFDRRVMLELPDKEGRAAILKIHAKGKPFVDGLEWERVAKRTVGFSGADLENMLNEAAILAAREGKTKIDMVDLEEAATKVKLGPEKKRLQSDLDRKMTAYHEAGHAVVTRMLPHMDPVHRISIVSRGMSLGHTLIPPAADRLHETKSHLEEQIISMLGGRAAEDIIFNEITTGASNDIQNATAIARDMIVEYGMSSLGPVNLDPESAQFLSRYGFGGTKISENMTSKVDELVNKMINDSLKKAMKILKENKNKLDKVANKLLEVETLEGEEFEKIMAEK